MKVMYIIVVILIISVTFFVYMAHAANRKVERQKYEVVKQEEGFEIRFYPRAIMATVTSRRHGEGSGGNQHFRTLAGYIFGGNKTEKKIAMTAPVYMESDTGANKMSFVLPSAYTMSDLPEPNDSNVQLHYSEEGYYAALRFGGFAGESKKKIRENELNELLHAKGYTVTGAFTYLGYNAPWELIDRENEIIVKIDFRK